MSSTAVLRTPPTSTAYRSDCISLRPPRGGKDKSISRENSPSPTTFPPHQRVKLSAKRSFGDTPAHPSPSPLRKRVLFERGSSGQCDSDSDEDDEPSPSLGRLHSPFVSRCASPFLGLWATHGSKIPLSGQPIEDDEGLFLSSKTIATPTHTPARPAMARIPSCGSHYQNQTSSAPPFAKLILTPSPIHNRKELATLSPAQPPRMRLPQTPAETEWHMGKQTESLTKLSLDDEDYLGRYRTKHGAAQKEQDSSPSPISRRGHKRSLDGNELPRTKGALFETFADTPVSTSFRLPELPSSINRVEDPATAFFGPSIRSPLVPSVRTSHLSAVTSTPNSARSRTPSPRLIIGPVIKKYKPRDSGIAGFDDDDDDSEDGLGPLAPRRDVLSPPLNDASSGFVTPGFEPPTQSAWPDLVFSDGQQGERDELTFKALAAGAAPPKNKKIMPGTPVKRSAYTHSRPWMSSSKAMLPPTIPRAAGVPRKSLPLSFPTLSQIQNSPDDSDTSPSDRSLRRKAYGELGKGRPGMLLSRGGGSAAGDSNMSLSMRRSSSGAFSSSSSEDSLLGSPSKPEYKGLSVPRTTEMLLKCPNSNRLYTNEPRDRLKPRRSFGFLSRPLTEYERPGKFESDFETIDNLGVGEFGSVLKVRSKDNNENEIFAVKKSKRFEGVKHRRRLREEVDVLQHLALVGGISRNPNVLRYVDSWEQDDMLYIQTELCKWGNFGSFLREFAALHQILEEVHLWKICAELSNGLKFIHEAGVIHLDLKPANIFISEEGKFVIGDFGMASLWPRRISDGGFEREGDREYMAPEVLQGRYGKEADIFSFGMIMLEITANIDVPDMGDQWQKLRDDDLSWVDFRVTAHSRRSELTELITDMMRKDPVARPTIRNIFEHPVVRRTREAMVNKAAYLIANEKDIFYASALASEPDIYLEEVLQIQSTRPDGNFFMDLSS